MNVDNSKITADEIVKENFKGLDDIIEDEDILYFYKELIKTCLTDFTASQTEPLLKRIEDLEKENEKLKEVADLLAGALEKIIELDINTNKNSCEEDFDIIISTADTALTNYKKYQLNK